jgi:hypothetical protein
VRDVLTRTAVELVIALVLVVGQVALFQWMRATSTTRDSDPFDSPVYWWSWLLIAGVALFASYTRPTWGRWRWSGVFVVPALLILPLALEVALLGTVWFNPDHGASFWLLGEVFVWVQGVVTLAAAAAGAFLRDPPWRTSAP